MSKSYREDCNDAKAARRGIVEQRPVGGKSKAKADRPIVIEYRWKSGMFPEWMDKGKWLKWKAYRTLEEAETVLANQQRKNLSIEYRIKPSEGEQ